ncbi:hypothetical protein LOC70_10885 [Rhodopirellula sp. JC737]|nr:hypothetical protein [Crateriforma spongiae]MCC9656307.1 hypothetical protein [Rhodopirellula sp. JC737]
MTIVIMSGMVVVAVVIVFTWTVIVTRVRIRLNDCSGNEAKLLWIVGKGERADDDRDCHRQDGQNGAAQAHQPSS